MAKLIYKIKIQKQGAVSMTIPMQVVKTLDIKVKDYLLVSYDEQLDAMVIVQDKGQTPLVTQHRIKVQRQGAINMTIPMEIVRKMDIRIGNYVDVEFDITNDCMIVTKSKVAV